MVVSSPNHTHAQTQLLAQNSEVWARFETAWPTQDRLALISNALPICAITNTLTVAAKSYNITGTGSITALGRKKTLYLQKGPGLNSKERPLSQSPMISQLKLISRQMLRKVAQNQGKGLKIKLDLNPRKRWRSTPIWQIDWKKLVSIELPNCHFLTSLACTTTEIAITHNCNSIKCRLVWYKKTLGSITVLLYTTS